MNPRRLARIDVWNRKLHTYVGLSLLWFLWLFAFSGLLLNHPTWMLLSNWQERSERTSTVPLRSTRAGNGAETVASLMEALDLRGEVSNVRETDRGVRLRVTRPGEWSDVAVDAEARRAEVKATSTGAKGAFHALHTFNATAGGRERRDWLATTLWVIAMDGLCAGLLFLVASSLYMWLRARRLRLAGLTAFVLGLASCGYFVFGLG